MRRLALTALLLAPLSLAGCSDGASAPVSAGPVGLMGEWQSAEDANYMLKLDAGSYREFYEAEEVSNDKWQPVKSCEDPQPVEKTDPKYGGFQIWTKETDDRICYAISNWTADKVSLSYAGTTSAYTRVN